MVPQFSVSRHYGNPLYGGSMDFSRPTPYSWCVRSVVSGVLRRVNVRPSPQLHGSTRVRANTRAPVCFGSPGVTPVPTPRPTSCGFFPSSVLEGEDEEGCSSFPFPPPCSRPSLIPERYERYMLAPVNRRHVEH